MQEVSKLFIISEFLIFHWNNLSNMLLEIFQVTHQYFLFANEIVNICSVFCKLSFLLVVSSYFNVLLVMHKHFISICFCEKFE